MIYQCEEAKSGAMRQMNTGGGDAQWTALHASVAWLKKKTAQNTTGRMRKGIGQNMTNSKQKGARYERRVASLFKSEGYDAHRSQQYCGYNGDADVIGVPLIHIECKHQEQMRLYDWIAQAKRDARDGEIPVVIHKKNYCQDLVTMEFSDWIKLYKEWEAGK